MGWLALQMQALAIGNNIFLGRYKDWSFVAKWLFPKLRSFLPTQIEEEKKTIIQANEKGYYGRTSPEFNASDN